jgi:hypothetical protein
MRTMLFALAVVAPTSAFAQTATVYYDSGYSASDAALTALGITHTAYDSNGPAFLADSASADLLIVEVPGGYWPAEVGTAISTALGQGKLVITHHWAYDFDSVSAPLLPALGIATPTIYDFSPSDLFSTGSPVDFFAVLGGALTQGQDLAGYDNTYFSLSGAGTIAATNASGQGAIAVTNNDTTIVNGYVPWDWQYTDVNGNGKPDGQDVVEAEIDYLLNGATPRLTLNMTGSCPGTIAVAITNGTPNGPMAVVRSNGTGAFTIPSGPCSGVALGLGASGISLLATPNFNASGNKSASPTLGVCNKYYQIVNLTTCEVSNVVNK